MSGPAQSLASDEREHRDRPRIPKHGLQSGAKIVPLRGGQA